MNLQELWFLKMDKQNTLVKVSNLNLYVYISISGQSLG